MKQLNSNIIKDIIIKNTDNTYKNQLIQQCFDIVQIIIIAVNAKAEITFINKKGEEILGYCKKDVINKNLVSEFIINNKQQISKDFLNKVINNKQVNLNNYTFHLKSENNQVIIIDSKIETITDEKNNVIGLLISGDNVTNYVKNQNNLERDIKLYRILANNIPDINLYLFNRDLKFILAEGNEMKNNDLNRYHFEDKYLNEVPNKKLIKIWEPLFKSALNGNNISVEYQLDNYYYYMWVIPIKNDNNEIYSGVAITQNITDDKIIEEKLKKSKEESEKANRAKTDFLARVSHEIRTPLNAILGFTEQLLQTKLSETQQNFVEIIDKSSEHLLSLINDILVLSKIEARQIRFDKIPFKIEYLIKYLYNTLLTKAQEKNLQFKYDIDKKLDIVIIGDDFRLKQILLNMLGNAIKFTNQGYVELKCFLQDETENDVKIKFDITDTGIGISENNLKNIFTQFNQADPSISKTFGGTGLGLTICKNLIELQNGSLTVASQKNTGTTFSFVIPYKKGKESDIIPSDLGNIDSEKLKNIKVLLVDDDSVNRLLGETILIKFNCILDIAKNGNEAIQKLDKNTYDVIILDIHMPDISGIDVAKYLKQKKKNRKEKIIAVTAAAMKDDVQNYYRVGIDDFLIKPFKELSLFNKLCETLQIQNQAHEIPKAEIILKEEIKPKQYKLNGLRKISNNNGLFIIKMIKTFIENSEDAIHKFQINLEAEKWNEIGEVAHKILPSYRHFEVNDIVLNLTEIKNKTLVKPNYNDLPELLEKTINSIKLLIIELKKELA